MIDPRLLRDDPDRVRAAQAKRGLSADVVDRALAADSARRQAIADFESRRAEQKASGALVAKAQGEEKQTLLAQVKELAAGVKAAEAARNAAEAEWDEAIRAIPNVADDAAPAGGEEDYTVIEHVGTPARVRLRAARPRRARPAAGRDRPRARRQGQRLALLLPHRRRRPAPARAGQHGDGPGPRGRLHPGRGALAGPPARDGGHRLPRPGGRRRLPDRGRGPLPRRHVGGADGGLPLRRDPRRRVAARCATPRSARASARRPARTARTPRASGGCTGSTRSRCSSTRRVEESYAEHQRLLAWEREFLDKLELSLPDHRHRRRRPRA